MTLTGAAPGSGITARLRWPVTGPLDAPSMEVGSIVQGAGEVIRFLPRRTRTWAPALALVVLFALLVARKCDDLAMWLWQELSAALTSALGHAFSELTS